MKSIYFHSFKYRLDFEPLQPMLEEPLQPLLEEPLSEPLQDSRVLQNRIG